MKFEARQRIAGTLDEVERAMFDERYGDFLLQNHGVLLEVKLLEKRDEGGKIHRKIRYLPKPVISSIGPKTVKPEWFAFVESSSYDKGKKELTFTNVATSGHIARMLVNNGTLRLRDAGGQTERVVEGEISLKLPFLLKPVGIIGERIIHSEGMKILDGEVPVLNRFISEILRK